MEFSIKFDKVQSGWSIVYSEGSQVIISKCIVFLSLKIILILANSVATLGGISSGSSLFAKAPG